MSRSNQLQIDSLHARAICDEIGERLRPMLRPETAALARPASDPASTGLPIRIANWPHRSCPILMT